MKTRYILLCALMMGSSLYAQTQYDAATFAEGELNGTARYVGMGGAMGALGADISVIGSNPAGIGLFRGNDFSATMGFNNTRTKSSFGGNNEKDDRTKASFDQIGFVYSNKIGNRTDLRYVNFGFNYHKKANFNKRMFNGGMLSNGLSQTQQMANMMADFTEKQIDDIYNFELDKSGPENPYLSAQQYPYLGVLGVRNELVSLDGEGNKIGWLGEQNAYRSDEEGGISQYDFNVSFNVRDRMFFGITLGIYDLDYKKYSYYTEDIYDGNHNGYYEMQNMMATEGTGVDVKIGAIFRPIEDSPFRLGFAIHTPTWYSLTYYYNSYMNSSLVYRYDEVDNNGKPVFGPDGNQQIIEEKVEVEDDIARNVNGDVLSDYRLNTPWKFNISMGTVVAGTMAIGAEYEYADFASSKLLYDDGYKMEGQNSIIKEDLKGVHTVKLGIESRLTPEFSMRAGYNYSTSIYERTAYKALNWNDMRTDVDYNNTFSKNTVTFGLGYAGRYFYADMAYKYNMYKSDFYAFSDEGLAPVKVDNERHQVLFTVGAHF